MAIKEEDYQTLKANVHRLVAIIKSIPGHKIVSMTIGGEHEAFVMDINENGRCGYHRSHRLLFMDNLMYGMVHGAGMIIRQFNTGTIDIMAVNGKKMTVPRKTVYSVFLGQRGFTTISAEQMRIDQDADCKTGTLLPEKEGVSYGSLDEFCCDGVPMRVLEGGKPGQNKPDVLKGRLEPPIALKVLPNPADRRLMNEQERKADVLPIAHTCLTCGRQTCDRQPEDNDPEDCKDWKPRRGKTQ